MTASATIHDFLVRYYGLSAKFAETDDLLAALTLDSLKVMEIIMFLEMQFQLNLQSAKLTRDDFASIAKIGALVERQTRLASAAERKP